jgi:hypothetical protein
MVSHYTTSKTPAGLYATDGPSLNALWNSPGNYLRNAPGRRDI